MIKNNGDIEENVIEDIIVGSASSCSMQSYEEQIEANELKLSFVSMVSHEFRGPLP